MLMTALQCVCVAIDLLDLLLRNRHNPGISGNVYYLTSICLSYDLTKTFQTFPHYSFKKHSRFFLQGTKFEAFKFKRP